MNNKERTASVINSMYIRLAEVKRLYFYWIKDDSELIEFLDDYRCNKLWSTDSAGFFRNKPVYVTDEINLLTRKLVKDESFNYVTLILEAYLTDCIETVQELATDEVPPLNMLEESCTHGATIQDYIWINEIPQSDYICALDQVQDLIKWKFCNDGKSKQLKSMLTYYGIDKSKRGTVDDPAYIIESLKNFDHLLYDDLDYQYDSGDYKIFSHHSMTPLSLKISNSDYAILEEMDNDRITKEN